MPPLRTLVTLTIEGGYCASMGIAQRGNCIVL
jgi:hypothetical protein